MIARTDGLTVAVVVVGTGTEGVGACRLNQWAAGVTLPAIPTTTDYFPDYDVLPF